MFCSKCGKEAEKGKEFCAKCSKDNTGEMKYHTTTLILAIVGLVFALILPIITYLTSIPALVMMNKQKETHKTKAILIMCTIALVVAVINSALGVWMQFS